MRWKIITVNSVVLVLVGVLLYALLRAQLSDLVSNPTRIRSDATRAVAAANAQLQLDALRIEQWLDRETDNASMREPFKAGTLTARYEAATQQCNRVIAKAKGDTDVAATPPAIVALVDVRGVSLGRNDSNMMRGEDLGKTHPRMKKMIETGRSGSEIWYSRQLSQQWFVSYATIRDAGGEILGGIVYGTPLNDERMTRTGDSTSGGAVVIAVAVDQGLEVVAKSSSVPPPVAEAIARPPVADGALGVLKQGHTLPLAGGPSDWVLVARPLDAYGDGKQALLVATSPAVLLDISGLVWNVLGVVALGIVLVSVGGVLLGNYISKPVEEIEEGLLQILNGQTNLRFEIEHAVLGGLVYRVNQLLNQLMGVAEDDTDEEGRPSLAPSAQAFQGALEVDENATAASTEQVDARAASALAAEPADQYYRRIFDEYIGAKRSIGDPVDHITEPSFVERIKQRETEMGQKLGRSVRYQVQLRGKEVVLIAVPLP
jgi:hypothetical protein